jgi:hypothetical protein
MLLALAAGLAACGTPGTAGAERPAVPAAEAPAPSAAEKARWLLTFTAPPVATRFAGGADTGTEGSREDRMRAYAESLKRARVPSLQALRLQGWLVLSSSEYSANTVVIEAAAPRTPADIEALRRLPGVASVQPAGLYRADAGASAPSPAPSAPPTPR